PERVGADLADLGDRRHPADQGRGVLDGRARPVQALGRDHGRPLVKRLFWIGVGVAVTVVVLKQVSKLNTRVNDVATAISPSGIAASVSSLAENVATLGTQLRESMAQNEEALRKALLPDE